jgi:catalase-peroxidase
MILKKLLQLLKTGGLQQTTVHVFYRLAWHSAGTYRIADGRGGAGFGTQKICTTANPGQITHRQKSSFVMAYKTKYGNKVSWADLMVLVGNCA